MNELLTQILKVCIIPLAGILTKYIVDFLSAKRDEIKSKTSNETAQKYIDMLTETVSDCVVATNQTYVDSLKASGDFDEAAQKEAFQKTMTAVLSILTDDAKEYLTSITGDLNTYLTQLIEAKVNTKKEGA
jgi:hypothetical protein